MFAPPVPRGHAAYVARNRSAGLRHRSLLLVAVAALFFTACDGVSIATPGSWPEGFVLDGLWQGEVGNGRFEITLTEDAAGFVSGMGVWIRSHDSLAFRVDGIVSIDAGVVTLLFDPSSFAAPGSPAALMHYRAAPWGRHDLRGRLNGGGFNDVNLDLRRTLTSPRFSPDDHGRWG
jgi:hypothetical protein